MAIIPADKYLLSDYRSSLRTQDAPQFIDTQQPIQAVLDIQKGLPQPNARQRLRYTFVKAGGTQTGFQIATVASNLNIYFLGYAANQETAAAGAAYIFDGTSGNGPTVSANTAYQEILGYLYVLTLAAVVGTQSSYIFPLPIKLINGLRVSAGGATQGFDLVVFYMEEIVL